MAAASKSRGAGVSSIPALIIETFAHRGPAYDNPYYRGSDRADFQTRAGSADGIKAFLAAHLGGRGVLEEAAPEGGALPHVSRPDRRQQECDTPPRIFASIALGRDAAARAAEVSSFPLLEH